MIAKLASGRAKPGGVQIVPAGHEAEFMKGLDLAEIPGVGPALVEALRRRGLVRIEEALEVQQAWLERWFGAHRGRWLHRRMRGLDPSRVDPREPRKSISSERTFFQDLKSDEDLERVLLRLCRSVTHTLRKGTYPLGNRTVTIDAGSARLDDGTLAGSVLTMDAAVRNLVDLGVSLPDAVAAATAVPARAVQRPDMGRLAVGTAADLAIISNDLFVERTLIAGAEVFPPS